MYSCRKDEKAGSRVVKTRADQALSPEMEKNEASLADKGGCLRLGVE
jgi:hypothetical protein